MTKAKIPASVQEAARAAGVIVTRERVKGAPYFISSHSGSLIASRYNARATIKCLREYARDTKREAYLTGQVTRLRNLNALDDRIGRSVLGLLTTLRAAAERGDVETFRNELQRTLDAFNKPSRAIVRCAQ